MRPTPAYSLYCSLCSLILSYSVNSFANEHADTATALTVHEAVNASVTLDIANENDIVQRENSWTLSAIDYANLSNAKLDETQDLAQLFTLDKTKNLQLQINESFQTGLYSLKNNYVLSGNSDLQLTKQFLVPNLAQHNLFQYGRFRTETGYSTSIDENDKSIKAFLHSAYSLINHGRFELSVTASIESFDTATNINRLEPLPLLPNYSDHQLSTNTTLGVMGSIDLSTRWSLIGAITTSYSAGTKANTVSSEDNEQKMAIIGTTYSF